MGGPPRTTVGRVGRVGGHLRLLGYFWIAYSALRMTAGWFLHEFFGRFFAYNFWSPHLPFLFPGLLRGIGMILLASGLLGMLTGWGLLERQPWARTSAIVLGVFALFQFGVGTALGIYTLWVLLPAESAEEYQSAARAV